MDIPPWDPRWAYRDEVRRAIEHRLADLGNADVDDVQQRVAIQLSKRPGFPGVAPDKHEAYAWTAVNNAVIDEFKRVIRRRAHQGELDRTLGAETYGSEAEDATREIVAEEFLGPLSGQDSWRSLLAEAARCGATVESEDEELVRAAVGRFLPILVLDLYIHIDRLRYDSRDIGAVVKDVESNLSESLVVRDGHWLAVTPNDRTGKVRQRVRRNVWPGVAHITRILVDQRVAPRWSDGRAAAWWVGYVGLVPVRSQRPRSAQPWMQLCERQLREVGLPLPPGRAARGRTARPVVSSQDVGRVVANPIVSNDNWRQPSVSRRTTPFVLSDDEREIL